MVSILTPPAVVLSYGRSGSVLIAHNLSRRVGTLPVYIKDSDSTKEFIIGHSHLMRPNWYSTRVFSIRTAFDCVISQLLARDQHTYHTWATDLFRPMSQELDLLEVKTNLIKFKTWHHYYAPTLCENDFVIDYETMKLNLHPNQVYRETFPEKEKLVLNYDMIKTDCKELIEECNVVMQRFVNHSNLIDIYQFLEI